jgi:hypothetical protein
MEKKRIRRPAADAGRIANVEELLVADDRAGLSPADMVEQKLLKLLKRNPLPVSQLHVSRRLIGSR